MEPSKLQEARRSPQPKQWSRGSADEEDSERRSNCSNYEQRYIFARYNALSCISSDAVRLRLLPRADAVEQQTGEAEHGGLLSTNLMPDLGATLGIDNLDISFILQYQ
jgi:hypothetical protein